MKYQGVPIQKISIISYPKIFTYLVLIVIKDLLVWFKNVLVNHGKFLVLLIATWMLISYIQKLQTIKDVVYFAVYWIVLGVASSIGLGTGLHTFVLYLGPFIAKLSVVATQCGYIPEMIPSKWKFDHFSECKESQNNGIGIIGIILAVQMESFLWGLGTALGQLPPYFVAKKAAQTQAQLKRMNLKFQDRIESNDEERQILIQSQKTQHISNQQINQILQLKQKANPTFLEKSKIIIYDNLQKYGFWAILACASIPNPLFDLAGITCGHFRIPFKTFFGATFIGKAIIKVHIQMVLIVLIFRKQSLDFIISLLKLISQSFSALVEKIFEQNKKVLYQPSSFKENKPFLGVIWDIFIIGMVLYFLKSIIDAQVQEKALQLQDSTQSDSYN